MADIMIKSLFDSSKDIYRSIEKVITYSASQEARLKAEITEYIATSSIDAQFETLLRKMGDAMQSGENNEVGVWVSGFYGSGKSSFTKYLGMALDERVSIDGVRFLKFLQDRMSQATSKALLASVATKYPAAVVMLDLASEMLAGARMEDVATVLYYKVLQWAGYSRNLKIADLERRLKKDGFYADFVTRIQQDLGVPWVGNAQNDPLVIDSVIPELAHAFYPQLFKTATVFNTEVSGHVTTLKDQVSEMLEIVRSHSGKPYVVFIVDEVGQYVSNRQNLILSLQGLAQTLKDYGQGRAWLIGTAQQTLTEDDPRAALNSAELYKLKDRFPIQINLEASDIREICYRRLLGKSAAGERQLGALFDKHGQALRHNTKLQDAKYYDANFDKVSFINLYPFLPAHFEILLQLLGQLAKSTGGMGLRSAIKVIQDILIVGPKDHSPAANQAVGWLASSVTLYDALERDIQRAFGSLHKGVEKVGIRFPNSAPHVGVAKTVAVLQILGNMPITPQNVASLMHPNIEAASQQDEVTAAIQALSSDPQVPFGEKDGGLCFFSEKLNNIDQERALLSLRPNEIKRIHNEALREIFDPLPRVNLHGTLTVTAGLKVGSASLAGERETVQMVIELVALNEFDATRERLREESRQRDAQSSLFLLGRATPNSDELLVDIWRCREIAQRYRNDPDTEIKDYCKGQLDRAARLMTELMRVLKLGLSQGSFIFRYQLSAVDSLDANVTEAAKKVLGKVAEQVFDRYGEAPHRAETALAEKLLRTNSLRAVTASLDPLGLVTMVAGAPRINGNAKALVSIRDVIERVGTLDGKRLMEQFGDAPYGWSSDTLRYLIAALLLDGQIRLKISGREVTVNGQHAIEALRTNNSFRTVGVSLRDNRPSIAVLTRAAERLGNVIGDTVIPNEDDLSKAANKHLTPLQARFGALATTLDNLKVAGGAEARQLISSLAELLGSDSSEAAQRFGAETSSLYDGLSWAIALNKALENGLEQTVCELQKHRQEIAALPDSDCPGALRAELAETLIQVGERLGQVRFYEHSANLRTLLTEIETKTRHAASLLAAQQGAIIAEAQRELQQLYGWDDVLQNEQSNMLGQLDDLSLSVSHDLAGLKQLINQNYVIQNRKSELKKRVEQISAKRHVEKNSVSGGNNTQIHRVRVPNTITSLTQLNSFIAELQMLKTSLSVYDDFEITLQVSAGED